MVVMGTLGIVFCVVPTEVQWILELPQDRFGGPEGKGSDREGDVRCTNGRHAAAAHEKEIVVFPGALVRVDNRSGPVIAHDVRAGDVVSSADHVAATFVR